MSNHMALSEAETIATMAVETARGELSQARTMGHTFAGPDVDLDAVPSIVAKARRLSRIPPFTRSDQPDLAQELTLAWERNRSRHVASRGTVSTLRKTVIDRTAAKLLQKVRATKRHGIATCSLQYRESTGDIKQMDPSHDRRRSFIGMTTLTAEQHVDLGLDIAEVLRGMPRPLLNLCHMLMYQTVGEICRSTGVAQSTISTRIAAIRRRFEKQNLQDLL